MLIFLESKCLKDQNMPLYWLLSIELSKVLAWWMMSWKNFCHITRALCLVDWLMKNDAQKYPTSILQSHVEAWFVMECYFELSERKNQILQNLLYTDTQQSFFSIPHFMNRGIWGYHVNQWVITSPTTPLPGLCRSGEILLYMTLFTLLLTVTVSK